MTDIRPQDNIEHDPRGLAAAVRRLTPEARRRIGKSLGLTPREHQIAMMLLDDPRELTIARELTLSRDTVHSHIRRLYRKLGVHTRPQLINYIFAVYLAHINGEPTPERAAPPKAPPPKAPPKEARPE